ncbi:MAG: serine protease [Acidobacteria bacterium]|nr:MAG: serine protease [Acidobacteriota bacterium]
MKPRVGVVTLPVALAVALCSTAATAATKPATANQPKGRFLVVFKADTLPSDATQRVVKCGGTVARALQQIGVVSATGNAAFAKTIAKDAKVLSVGPEQMFAAPDVQAIEVTADAAVPEGSPLPADSLYYYQWDIRRVGAPAVWARLPLTSTATPRVAVLDVGVMDTHPDLVGQVDTSVATSYCATGAGYPVYTTYIDLLTYPNWTPSDGCTALPFTDYEWHGTHVAGTIAAKFGGGRVVGVAPDAKIGAYKVFDAYTVDGIHLKVGAFDGPIFDAIIQATTAGYRVISMSLGSYGVRNDKDYNASWLAWDRVAKWANRNGALIVASAGNTSVSLNGTLFHIPSDLPTVVSTSATATSQLQVDAPGVYDAAPGSDYLASYSSYGAAVDIAAPGGDCPPPPLACAIQYYIVNDGINAAGGATYYGAAGTSMATPHVSAVAAWVFAMHPDWTPGDVRSWLNTTAEVIGSRQQFGHGLVNADAATQ